MANFRHLPRFLYRVMKLPRILYALGLGSLMGRLVLLLTTTGRKSGLPRVTPLQYETMDGVIYIGSARGQAADWFRNLVADPRVQVQVGARRFTGLAEPITESARVADFLELRLRRRPRLMGMMLRLEGLSMRPTRTELERLASALAVVAIRPESSS